MPIVKGTAVRQKMPAPIEGVVGGFKIDEATGETQVLVEWTTEEGSASRYFKASEIEEVPPAP